MFAGKKSAQIREILISESAWEEMTCLFAPSLMACVHWDDFCKGKTILFIKKRLVRILPMYYLFTFITIAAWVIYPMGFPSTILRPIDYVFSFVFIPSVYIKQLGMLTPVVSVGWTLCYEILFYLLFSIGLFFRRAIGLCFVFLFITILVSFKYFIHSKNMYFLFYTDDIMFYFLSGIVCFMIQRFIPVRCYSRKLSLALMVALLIFSTLYLQGIIQLLALTLSFYLFTAIEFHQSRETVMTKMVSSVGLASYSIYLSHRLFMGVAEKVIHLFIPNANTEVMYFSMAILIVSSVTFGYMVYWLIEKRITMIFRVKTK